MPLCESTPNGQTVVQVLRPSIFSRIWMLEMVGLHVVSRGCGLYMRPVTSEMRVPFQTSVKQKSQESQQSLDEVRREDVDCVGCRI